MTVLAFLISAIEQGVLITGASGDVPIHRMTLDQWNQTVSADLTLVSGGMEGRVLNEPDEIDPQKAA